MTEGIHDLAAPDLDAGGQLGTCPKQSWCVKEEGHRGYCRGTPLDEPLDPRGRKPARKHPGRARTPSPRPARAPVKPKVSLLAIGVSSAWEAAGRALERRGPEPAGPPAGRVMQFEAAYAGQVLRPALRKVPILARLDSAAGGQATEIAALFAAPIMAAAMSIDENLRDRLTPFFVEALKPIVVAAVTERRRVVEEMRAIEEYGEEAVELMQALIAGLFAPREEPDETSPGEPTPS